MSNGSLGGRIAVTGATGFVGQTVVESLSNSGYEVVGVSLSAEPPSRIADLTCQFQFHDLTENAPGLDGCTGLVHLAGLAAVGPSFDHPQKYISANSAMITNIFERALLDQWTGRAIVVSSGAVYGGNLPEKGFDETSPVLATSPYVVSKLLVERQAEYYRQRGLDIIVVRPFNHIGPGQEAGFIVPDLSAKVSQLAPGSMLSVGNLDSARDYTDVRDIAQAYQSLLELDEPRHSTYNVCSGVARSGWEILDAICTAQSRPTPSTISAGQRAIDPSTIMGDATRLTEETGWQPTVKLQTSIDDFWSGANS